MNAADITWQDYAWPSSWLAGTTALDVPGPAARLEREPIYEAAMAAHLATEAQQRKPEPVIVCPTCKATSGHECRTSSGRKARWHAGRRRA